MYSLLLSLRYTAAPLWVPRPLTLLDAVMMKKYYYLQ